MDTTIISMFIGMFILVIGATIGIITTHYLTWDIMRKHCMYRELLNKCGELRITGCVELGDCKRKPCPVLNRKVEPRL